VLQRLHISALAALAVAAAATAQERPSAEVKRGAYVVKHAAANDLAGILVKHFKGAAAIQAGPEGTSNCLLINAPPAIFGEVMKALEQLDRQPHAVAVEVFVVELPANKADEKAKSLDLKHLSGGIDDVAARVRAMMHNSELAGVKHIQLAALEGQRNSLMLGENRPFKMGVSTAYRQVGTEVKVTPQVAADGFVTLDLKMMDSRARSSADTGLPVFIMTSLSGKIRVASGHAVLAKDAKVISKEGQGETLIVVGARVIEPGAVGK
jgi:hypothetical protein